MSTAALALVLLSAFLHASWNALLKREKDTRVATAAVLLIAALAACAAMPFAKGPMFPTSAGLAWTIVAGISEGGYFLALAMALSRSPMGLAYAVARGGATLVVWPVSVLWLGERVTIVAGGGSALVVLGLLSTAEGRARASGMIWAWLCAFCIAGYHLAYKEALAEGAQPIAVFAVALGMALPPNVGALGLRNIVRRVASRPATLVGAGLLCTASFVLFLVALTRGGAGIVLTLRNTSVLFAYAMAYAIGERPTRKQLAGGVLIALGALLLGAAR